MVIRTEFKLLLHLPEPSVFHWLNTYLTRQKQTNYLLFALADNYYLNRETKENLSIYVLNIQLQNNKD